MKVVIECLSGGEIVSDYCFKGWLGAKNAGHDVILMSLSQLSVIKDRSALKDLMPIGSVAYMTWFFNYVHNMETPHPLNIHRVVPDVHDDWKEVESILLVDYPRFVKPLYDVKKFTGFVAKSAQDFELYPELSDWDGSLLTVVPFKEKILSEWRAFIHKDKVINLSCYLGDSMEFPDSSEISQLVKLYSDKAPISYTLDFAVLASWETKFIEANDMWAIGPYGCNEDDYFAMLKDRWNEIIKNKEYDRQ